MTRRACGAALAIAFAILLAVAPAILAKPGASGQSGDGHGPGTDGSEGSNGNAGADGGGPGNGNPGGNGNGNAGGNGNGNGNGGGQAGAGNGPPASDAGTGEPGQGNGQGNGNAAAGGSPDTPPGSTDPSAGTPAGESSSPAQAGGNAADSPGGNGRGPGHGSVPGGADGQSSQAPGNARGQDDAFEPPGPVLAPGSAPGHPAAGTQDDAGPVAAIPVIDASHGLRVDAGRAGNVLTWDVPAAAQQVQVWRLENDGWVPVAAVEAAATGFTDADGGPLAQYRLTWSSESLGDGGLALAATMLPMVSAPESKGLGPTLTFLLWGGIGALAFVRTNVPRRLLETRPGLEHPLAPLLAGLPGVDVQTVERVSALGLRTVAQLRAVDADTLAFWARIPATMVRHWKESVELLVWPGLPAGAGERLALAGHGTLAHLAAAQPADLMQRLRTQSGVEGPGLPADEGEVAGWIIEARLALGMADQPARTVAEATVEQAQTLRPTTSASAV